MSRRWQALCWVVSLVAMLGGALALLSRTWTWASVQPTVYILTASPTWQDESPWGNRAGVWTSAMPKLTKQMNSPAFLDQVKACLASHDVVRHWTAENTTFEPMLLSSGGPLVVNCEAPGPCERHWSLWNQGVSLKQDEKQRVEKDLQRAIQELVKPLAASESEH